MIIFLQESMSPTNYNWIKSHGRNKRKEIFPKFFISPFHGVRGLELMSHGIGCQFKIKDC